MNSEPTQTIPGNAEAAEPQAARNAVPVWLFVLLFVLLYVGLVYFDQHGGWFDEHVYVPYRSYTEVENCQPKKEGMDLALGKAKFETICALCHNPDGMGKANTAPPFVGSEWVLGSPNRLIRIPNNGLAGPVHVLGKAWSEQPSMTAMGNTLSDEELAAVLTYMRNSWGNHASPITTEQVHKVRQEIASRNQPWTEDLLDAIP